MRARRFTGRILALARFSELGASSCGKARKRLERLKRVERALARTVNPFALLEDAALWASVARGQPFSVPQQTAEEGSLVAQIKRAMMAAAQAAPRCAKTSVS